MTIDKAPSLIEVETGKKTKLGDDAVLACVRQRKWTPVPGSTFGTYGSYIEPCNIKKATVKSKLSALAVTSGERTAYGFVVATSSGLAGYAAPPEAGTP